ncbi:hypothetical protein F2P81_015590 [Scophthalmus maximus]|uniref:Uncharacterized protein n=1 Tax=Scophthalmus maximus TaxID=52904 RepID=A0A6A4SMY3_SCOMX|nr:hypothetical protein F2P81_015590 [Scophthalmus maximus]
MPLVVDAVWALWSIGAGVYDYFHTSAMEERIDTLENALTIHQFVITGLSAGLILLLMCSVVFCSSQPGSSLHETVAQVCAVVLSLCAQSVGTRAGARERGTPPRTLSSEPHEVTGVGGIRCRTACECGPTRDIDKVMAIIIATTVIFIGAQGPEAPGARSFGSAPLWMN